MVDAAGHRDPDRGIAIRPVERLGRQQVNDPAREAIRDVGRQLDPQPVGGSPEPRDVLVELGHAARPRAKGLEHGVTELEAAIEDGQVAPRQRVAPPVNPHVSWLHRSMIGSRLRRRLQRLRQPRADRALLRRSRPTPLPAHCPT